MIRETLFSHIIVSATYFTLLPSQHLKSSLKRLKELPSGHRTASHLVRDSKILSNVLFKLVVKPKMVTYGLLGISLPFSSLSRLRLCKNLHLLKVIKL